MAYYTIGSKGDEVKKLQQALTGAGFDAGGSDGIYGPKTAAAVTAYQKANNLTQDGIAGTQTLGSLYKPAMPAATQPTVQKPVVQNTTPATNQISSGLTNTPSAVETALDNVSPQRQKANELIEQLLGGLSSTPYNPATDTSFQAAKANLEQSADREYSNVNADYLGNQSGNFNSAALQIASGAKNDLLSQVPLLQGEYEDRYNTNQRNKLNDTSSMVNMLLGIDEADYNRTTTEEDRKKQDFLDTMGQYSDNYQARINTVEGDNDPSNDYESPYLKAARAQKIAGMEESKLSAQDKAVKQAFEMWETMGYATPQVAELLGIPVNSRTADYADTLADNARAAANSSDENKSTLTTTQYFNQAKALADEMVETGESDLDGEAIMRPKYTKEQFDTWLASLPINDKELGDIMDAIDYDNLEFYVAPVTGPDPRYRRTQ